MPQLSPFRGPQDREQFIANYEYVMRKWPVACEERDLDTSFGSTHVLISGPADAPPLVLLHGASATALMWQPIIEDLSRSYRCYALDTITDTGKSVMTRAIGGAADYVEWLQQIYRLLGIEKAHVMGLSYGGWLATTLALYAPDRVNQLIMLCPGATLAPLTAMFWMKVLPACLLRSPTMIRNALAWMSTRPDAASHPFLQILEISMATARPLRKEFPIPNVFTDEELRRISVPTTVMIGDHEVIYRGGAQAALSRAQRLIPNVRTHLLPNASHLLPLDCPEVLVEKVREALARS